MCLAIKDCKQHWQQSWKSYARALLKQQSCHSHVTVIPPPCHGHATAMPRPCHGHATAMQQKYNICATIMQHSCNGHAAAMHIYTTTMPRPCHSRATAISDKHISFLMVLLTAAKCFMFQRPGFNTIHLLFSITIKKHLNKIDLFFYFKFFL